jgi:hypothetical protein
MLVISTGSTFDVLVTLTVKLISPPGSLICVGDAVFVTLIVASSTLTGTSNVSSQTHFAFVSGLNVDAFVMLLTVPWLLCQLVQFGRFSMRSPSVSWQATPESCT